MYLNQTAAGFPGCLYSIVYTCEFTVDRPNIDCVDIGGEHTGHGCLAFRQSSCKQLNLQPMIIPSLPTTSSNRRLDEMR